MKIRWRMAGITLVAALAACAPTKNAPDSNTRSGGNAETLPTEAPSITGTVTTIRPERTLLIEENPADESGSAKAHVKVSNDVAIWDRGSGAKRTFEDLRQGETVSAWFTGPVAESYPVQAIASAIVIERAGAHHSTPDGSTPTDVTVDAMGVGPVRAGMTLAEAERALGVPLPLLGPKMEPCYYVTTRERPGLAFMIIQGRVARVDVQQQSTIRTVEGARIGDTEDRIHSLYPGRVEVQPHKYVEGRYLIVTPAAPADSSHRIIFETDGKRVTRYRAGRLPEVRWIEGCS